MLELVGVERMKQSFQGTLIFSASSMVVRRSVQRRHVIRCWESVVFGIPWMKTILHVCLCKKMLQICRKIKLNLKFKSTAASSPRSFPRTREPAVVLQGRSAPLMLLSCCYYCCCTLINFLTMFTHRGKIPSWSWTAATSHRLGCISLSGFCWKLSPFAPAVIGREFIKLHHSNHQTSASRPVASSKIKLHKEQLFRGNWNISLIYARSPSPGISISCCRLQRISISSFVLWKREFSSLIAA